MPLTTVDATPALIVIDLQAGIAPHAPASVIENNSALTSAFRAAGHTVVLVNVVAGAPGRTEQNPAGGGSQIPAEATVLIDALNAADTDITVSKRTWGAFASTDLHAQLEARGVTQVFVTGVATSIGAESTAREAHALGYNVVVIPDAMGDLSPEAHDAAVALVFPRLAEITTTSEVVAALGEEASA
jgi:nicotinamidase-related amidase